MLRATRTVTSVRALIAGSLVATAVSLAACGDASTAPNPAPATPIADAQTGISLNFGATIKVRIADTTGATLKETAWVTIYSGNDTLRLRDNAPGDLDATVGFVKAMVSKTNNYRVEAGRSAHYMPDLDGFVNWQYIAKSTSAGMTVDMGTLVLQRSPMFRIYAKDEFGKLVGPATYNLKTDVNWSIDLQDGDWRYDESAGVDGIMIYTLNFPFIVNVCEVMPPSKMVLTSQKCFSFPAKWGKTYDLTFTHEHVAY